MTTTASDSNEVFLIQKSKWKEEQFVDPAHNNQTLHTARADLAKTDETRCTNLGAEAEEKSLMRMMKHLGVSAAKIVTVTRLKPAFTCAGDTKELEMQRQPKCRPRRASCESIVNHAARESFSNGGGR